MIRYLDWLSELKNRKPFALLLDSYKAHMQKQVLDHARELKIDLIFIPPCGTSIFQPLDRFVFGFLKQKLRTCDVELNESCGDKRFSIIHQKVSKF